MATSVIFQVSALARALALVVMPAALVVACAGQDTMVKSESYSETAPATSVETSPYQTESDVLGASSESHIEITGDSNNKMIAVWETPVHTASGEAVTSNNEDLSVNEDSVIAKVDTKAESRSPVLPESLAGVQDSRYMDVKLIEPKSLEIAVPDKFVFHFASEQYDIAQAELDDLNKHAKYLRHNPGMALHINGYSDSRGSASYNHKLSKKRAEVIEKALIALGVSASQLIVNAYGEGFPMNDESNYDENRRVELEYIELDTALMASN